jgi:hypothetical protein
MRRLRWLLGSIVLATPVGIASAEEKVLARIVEEIRREAMRPSRGEAGRPLPLAAHWNASGANRAGFHPSYQRKLLEKGHHILPWLDWPPTDRALDSMFKRDDPRRKKYIEDRIKEYEPIVKELARRRLPISFLATQWESVLSYDKTWSSLPADKNPNVIGLDGKVRNQVDPLGPTAPWREAGRTWTSNAFLEQIQRWYPDPPLVLLISNNEHAKLAWTDVEQSKRYLDKYGPGRDDDFKRKVVGDGWIERYSALIEGMRSGLAESWRKKARFIGYEAFPPVHFGRWGGWKEYSLYTKGRLDPWPLCWDGGSPSYYLHNWMALTDYTLWSPQVESMNWVFMLDAVHRAKPDFWFELSTWDGDSPGQANDKRKFYARQGQLFTPARYEGFVQFGMWLTRPRLVREFRGYLETVEYAGPYFDAVLDAVDRVHAQAILRKFWRKGKLVANRKGRHPFQADIPPEYKDAERWFLLQTNLTPKELRAEEFDNARPPSRQTEIPVFALALVLGESPNREWLVYAHAPRQARVGVKITVPGYGVLEADVPQSGAFYHVREKDNKVEVVHRGGPESFRMDSPGFAPVDQPASFSVTEQYTPAGKLDSIEWKFGDGGVAKGARVTHRFGKPGQYLVSASGVCGGKEAVRREAVVFAGLKPEEGLICRLLMKGVLSEGMKSWIWLSGWDKVEYHFIPDASGAGNIGFLAGGTWAKDEKRGLVLELDGKRDRVEISNSAQINTGSAYPRRTIAFWFRDRAEEKDKPKVQRQVLYEEGGPGAGFNLYLEGGVLYAGAWNQGKGTWLHGKKLARDEWRHAALVVRREAKGSETTLELYLDGQRIDSGKAPVVGAHPGDINLGRCGSSLFHDGRAAPQPGYYFAGRFDDFRLANRALSAEEIRALVKSK